MSIFLEAVNSPFIEWLEIYLKNQNSSSKLIDSKTNDSKIKLEVIPASEIEDEILDFEEEPQDDEQIKNKSFDDFNDEINDSTESTNKRKIDEIDDLDCKEDCKRLMNNDKESIKINQSQNVIKLTNNSHLNDIGLMRRKAMEEKNKTQSPQKQPQSFSNQSTKNEQSNDNDDFFDLRDKLNSRNKNSNNSDDEIDEQMESSVEQKTDDDEKKERCKFWPFCKKESECIYAHPIEQCKQFPSCKLGADKCLFIHPLCKFDAVCTKKDCPFLHIAKKPQLLLPTVQPHVMHVECKFFPNCYNVNCPFIHPKLCIFGTMCKNLTCTFKHPETPHAKRQQLYKWTKSAG